MLAHPTLDQLHAMGLYGMAKAFSELNADPECQPASKFDPRSAFNIDPSGAGVCSRPAA